MASATDKRARAGAKRSDSAAAGGGRRAVQARKPARDARPALLQAAAEVFSERGFAAASVDEIAARAGYSKGAVYWHFASKDDLFFELLRTRVDSETREMTELLRSAPPEQDMAPEASRRFGELIQRQRELLLLDYEHWAQAVRDPELRDRYDERWDELRTVLGAALEARAKRLGTPVDGMAPEELATVMLSLANGLAQQKLIRPDAVPDHLLGEAIVLIYQGLVARARE